LLGDPSIEFVSGHGGSEFHSRVSQKYYESSFLNNFRLEFAGDEVFDIHRLRPCCLSLQ
jgi:hypothetical protein